jgi:hypothetical protein
VGHANGEILLWRQRMVVKHLPNVRVDPRGCTSSHREPSFLIKSLLGVRCLRYWQHQASVGVCTTLAQTHTGKLGSVGLKRTLVHRCCATFVHFALSKQDSAAI